MLQEGGTSSQIIKYSVVSIVYQVSIYIYVLNAQANEHHGFLNFVFELEKCVLVKNWWGFSTLAGRRPYLLAICQPLDAKV